MVKVLDVSHLKVKGFLDADLDVECPSSSKSVPLESLL